MRPCAHTLPPPSCSYPFHRYGVHLQGEAQDRMNALMERTQELGMRFTHSVVDPAALGMLRLTGGLAGEAPGCCCAWIWKDWGR